MARGKSFRSGCLGTLAVAALLVLGASFFAARKVELTITGENVHALRELDVVDEYIWEVRWSPDGRRVAFVRWEQPVEIRNGRTLRLERVIGEGKKIIHFAFSPDPDVVAFCENGTAVEIRNLRTRDSLRLEASNDQPAMAFSPDGQLLATGGYGDRARVWDVRDGRLRRSLGMGPQLGGLTPVFSPDGSLLAVANRNSDTRIFDISSGNLIRRLHRQSTHTPAFSPDGSLLAVPYVDGKIGLWRVADGKLLALEDAGEEIYRVAWSPDGALLVSAGREADLVFWDPEELSVVHRLRVAEWVISASFRADGRQLLVSGGTQSAGGHRSLRILGVPLLDWLVSKLGRRDGSG
jgi:WD40 repeat protein